MSISQTPHPYNPDPPDPASFELPPGVHLPAPSYWPFTLAGGIALFLVGFILSPFFSLLGVILIAVALRGWVREMLHG